MKLLTLNTHSIIDESYDDKIKVFCEAIIKYEPDVIALQEVMQPITGEKAENDDLLKGVGRIPVKSGNFAYNVLKCLKKHNSNYHGVYFGIKKAYDKYDEGLAILSNREINTTEITQLTKFNDYNNEIIDYVIELDLTYEEKKAILEDLDMTVDEEGYIHWED